MQERIEAMDYQLEKMQFDAKYSSHNRQYANGVRDARKFLLNAFEYFKENA